MVRNVMTSLITALIIILSNSFARAEFDLSEFVTDIAYESKVLNASGKSVKGSSLLRCSYLCHRRNKCASLALNSSPEVSECILYESSLCDGSDNVTLLSKDGYRMYDRVKRTSAYPNAISCISKQPSVNMCLVPPSENPSTLEEIASSCSEYYYVRHNSAHADYSLKPRGSQTDFRAFCDMTHEGGGWTVLLSRKGWFDPNFHRNLTDYIDGFGDVTNDNWLGLERIFLLTSQEEVTLWLSFTDTTGRDHSIFYSKFSLTKTSNTSYAFTVGSFNCTSGLSDEFSKQQNVPFSVDSKRGGWWFSSDSTANLNGDMPSIFSTPDNVTSMKWSNDVLIKQAMMKLKSSYYYKCAN